MATPSQPLEPCDDLATVCAISLAAAILADVLHEGVGHAVVALLTGTQSGVLTTVAWSSNVDSRLVAAGGTLVNLAAAALLWPMLCSAVRASAQWRFFLLVSAAFNLLVGTGYFFFSGVTDFGDWAVVIAGLPAHAAWRTALILLGMASYYASVVLVGTGLVRYVGATRNETRRLRKLTYVPYFSSIVLACAAGFLNPIGIQLVWLSALPATAGGKSGLLWTMYTIPSGVMPRSAAAGVGRSYAWIAAAAVLSPLFIFVLGRGITLHR